MAQGRSSLRRQTPRHHAMCRPKAAQCLAKTGQLAGSAACLKGLATGLAGAPPHRPGSGSTVCVC